MFMNMSADRDIESQQMVLPSRKRLRWILQTLQACQILTSIAGKAKKAVASISSANTGGDTVGSSNFEVTEIEEVSDTSPQVSVDVRNVGTDESASGNVTTVGDSDRQRKCIAQIVKAKELQSLNDFGGLEGIAVALNTDLEKGITGDEKDIHFRCSVGALSKVQDPARRFFQLLLKSCNNKIIALLGLSAAFVEASDILLKHLYAN